jgi:DNA replication protein DnaC
MSIPTTREEIARCCKRLRLSRHLADNIGLIESGDREQFLLTLLQMELEHREAARRMRLIKSAGFYSLKTFENYVFDEVKLPSGLTVEALTSCAFVEERRNLICYGNVGTGKTHLATALGVECCRQGRHVRFTRTAALVNQLSQARKGGELQRFLKQLSKLDLLICDEWGYVPLVQGKTNSPLK